MTEHRRSEFERRGEGLKENEGGEVAGVNGAAAPVPEEPLPVRCCARCEFYAPPELKEALGTCHIAPPTCQIFTFANPTVQGGPPVFQTHSAWAPVRERHWCAEFIPSGGDGNVGWWKSEPGR